MIEDTQRPSRRPVPSTGACAGVRAGIDPRRLAFDIDGVIADTMSLFLDIAREEYQIADVAYEDITCYSLEDCMQIAPAIIREIVARLQSGDYRCSLQPMPGARNVLSRMGRQHGPVRLVTARPSVAPIYDWLLSASGLASGEIEVVATGDYTAKAEVLQAKGVAYFVEDRLDTCFLLRAAGITPILFRQPWNRSSHPFIEVGSWDELGALIAF
jgi:5'(3')-deoxyribonucleotidase